MLQQQQQYPGRMQSEKYYPLQRNNTITPRPLAFTTSPDPNCNIQTAGGVHTSLGHSETDSASCPPTYIPAIIKFNSTSIFYCANSMVSTSVQLYINKASTLQISTLSHTLHKKKTCFEERGNVHSIIHYQNLLPSRSKNRREHTNTSYNLYFCISCLTRSHLYQVTSEIPFVFLFGTVFLN